MPASTRSLTRDITSWAGVAELEGRLLEYSGARQCIPMTAELLQQEHDHIVKAVIEALGK